MRRSILAGALAVLLVLVLFGALQPEARAQQTPPLDEHHLEDPYETLTYRPADVKYNLDGEYEEWGLDTTLTRDPADANHDEDERLNVSIAGDGFPRSYALLRFDLHDWRTVDEPDGLPRNSSLDFTTGRDLDGNPNNGDQKAIVTLTQTEGSSGDIGLAAVPVLQDWNEGEVTWEDVLCTSCRTFLANEPADYGGGELAPGLRSSQIAFHMEDYYGPILSPTEVATDRGFVIRVPSELHNQCDQYTCRYEFRSSSHFTVEDEEVTPDDGVPQLELIVDKNPPTARDLQYEHAWEGDDGYYLAPGERLNFSAYVEDRYGRIASVNLSIHNESGALFWHDEIFAGQPDNRSSIPWEGPRERWTVWRNQTFDLPDDRYVFNLTVEDSDATGDNQRGRYFTNYHGDWNLTVESEPPRVHHILLSSAEVDPGEELTIRLNATDPHDVEDIHAVVTDPRGRTSQVGNFTPPDPNDVTENNWTRDLAFDDPGTYHLEFVVEDGPGNVNRTGDLTVEVVDTRAPQVRSFCIVRDRCTNADLAQEMGANATVRVEATDDHVLDPDVAVVATGPDGREIVQDLPKAGDIAWEGTLEFNATNGWEPTGWTLSVRIVDPGNNTGVAPEIQLDLDEAAPPQLVSRAPTGWANATPDLAFRLQDRNLDLDSVRVNVSARDQPFQPVEVAVDERSDGAVVEAHLGPYLHQDEVVVEAEARDLLDQGPDDPWTWNFTVDASDPRSSWGFDGPHREGLGRMELRATTHVTLAGRDADSGLHHLEHRLVPLGSAEPQPWIVAGDDPVNLSRSPGYEGSGGYVLQIRAVDEVGNREDPRQVEILIDNRPPQVQHEREEQRLEVRAVDPGAGLADLTVQYRNRSNPFVEVPTTLVARTRGGGTYVADLPFTPKGVDAQVIVTARDELGNERVLGDPDDRGSRLIRWTEPNHPPTLHVTTPEPGSVLQGKAPLLWRASDPDGDPVDVRLQSRPVVRDAFSTFARYDEAQGRHTWGTEEVPDGLHDLRFLATDGEDSMSRTLRVEVANTPLGVAELDLPQGRLDVGERAQLEVTLFRPVKTVEAHVYRVDGDARQLAATLPMRDDGAGADETAGDGVWSAAFTPEEEGRYDVGLDVLYGDDSRLERDDLSSFTVATSLADTFERNRAVFIVAGVVVAGVAAVALVQLRRYGYI